MGAKPVVDLRIYTIRRRSMPEFLRISETLAMPVQLRHIGPPLAYYVTDIGPQNQVIHLWPYDSVADMESRRAARNQDPEWQASTFQSRYESERGGFKFLSGSCFRSTKDNFEENCACIV